MIQARGTVAVVETGIVIVTGPRTETGIEESPPVRTNAKVAGGRDRDRGLHLLAGEKERGPGTILTTAINDWSIVGPLFPCLSKEAPKGKEQGRPLSSESPDVLESVLLGSIDVISFGFYLVAKYQWCIHICSSCLY